MTDKPQLDFDNQNTLYATHGLHAFAAKCPPQLVEFAVSRYSKPEELVIDPMMGSGTSLVESRLMGRNAIGYDIDPLARLIAQVKSQTIDDDEVEVMGRNVLRNARADLSLAKYAKYVDAPLSDFAFPEFHNRDYWFDSEVSLALAVLAHNINIVGGSTGARDFLWVTFSSLILARTSVANARDIIHSRHHFYQHAVQPDVLKRFESRLTVMRRQADEFRIRCLSAPEQTSAEARLGDARKLDLADDSADLVFSSPPYATALDYPRAHFLAIPWMKPALDIDLNGYRGNASNYIGSQQGMLKGNFLINEKFTRLRQTPSVLKTLAETSVREAKLCHRYFADMDLALGEMARILRYGRYAVIVVCPSHIRKIAIPTHEVLTEIAETYGLRLIDKFIRTINERRRVMPYISSFGNRMSTEYVLIFQKHD